MAIVTGGAQGIGRAIARHLAFDGVAVCVNYNANAEAAEELVAELRALGHVALAIQADVSEEAQTLRLVEAVSGELGAPNIVVNNAAIFPWLAWDAVTVDEWDRTFAVNSRGPWLMAKAAAPGMIDQGWGRVVNVASSTFLTGSSYLAHYSASKGAIVGLTRSLARALGPNGITVNAVSTGKTLTEGFQKYFDQGVLNYEETVASRESQPIPRMGEPSDLAAAVSFLASKDASFITGQLINVDGGRNMY